MSIRWNRNTKQWCLLVRLDHEAIIIAECDTLTEAIREAAMLTSNAWEM